jgi:hypothetical protein
LGYAGRWQGTERKKGKKKQEKPQKTLSPAMAERVIKSLTRLYHDNMEITDADFERIKKDIIRRVVVLCEHKSGT